LERKTELDTDFTQNMLEKEENEKAGQRDKQNEERKRKLTDLDLKTPNNSDLASK